MTLSTEPQSRLIVALDVDDLDTMNHYVKKLGDDVSFYKIGWHLFMKYHFKPLALLKQAGKKIFLDLKLGDIGTTIEKAIGTIPPSYRNDIEFITLQGAPLVVEGAVKGRDGDKPHFLFVSRLSSDATTHDDDVITNSQRALDYGASGLIASGKMVSQLRKKFPSHMIVTPAIRGQSHSVHEHKHALTPHEAGLAGADFLVVGRPILKAADPSETFHSMLRDFLDARS